MGWSGYSITRHAVERFRERAPTRGQVFDPYTREMVPVSSLGDDGIRRIVRLELARARPLSGRAHLLFSNLNAQRRGAFTSEAPLRFDDHVYLCAGRVVKTVLCVEPEHFEDVGTRLEAHRVVLSHWVARDLRADPRLPKEGHLLEDLVRGAVEGGRRTDASEARSHGMSLSPTTGGASSWVGPVRLEITDAEGFGRGHTLAAWITMLREGPFSRCTAVHLGEDLPQEAPDEEPVTEEVAATPVRLGLVAPLATRLEFGRAPARVTLRRERTARWAERHLGAEDGVAWVERWAGEARPLSAFGLYELLSIRPDVGDTGLWVGWLVEAGERRFAIAALRERPDVWKLMVAEEVDRPDEALGPLLA